LWYVGLEMHQKCSSICVLNEHGERVRAQTVIGPWAKLFEVFKAVERPFVACYEASIGYG
jgi:hypothetical protein